jgi:hypothetical protein
VKPTGITVSGASHFALTDSSSARQASTAVTFQYANKYAGSLNVTVASGLTQGHGATLWTNNSAASLLWTGAEL